MNQPNTRAVPRGPMATRYLVVLVFSLRLESSKDGPTAHRTFWKSNLWGSEIKKLLKVAKEGRYGQRDHLMVLMAFRHGLRVSVSRPGRSDIGSLAEHWFYL